MNSDGSSSQSNSQTTVPDELGRTTSTSSTTYYDVDGVIIRQVNASTDIDGNESTQDVGYDTSGNAIVTGYEIDTSENQSGAMSFNNNQGVNTGFYGFDTVDGFIMNIHFTIDFTDQPPADSDGQTLHNIVTMKRANPSPWYGFQLRQTGTEKWVHLGTQFSSGNNVTTVMKTQFNWVVQNQIAEYNLQITYDPNNTLSQNTFVCKNLFNDSTIYQNSNGVFPDIPELRYMTVCIGCALDPSGEPYRYSNVDVIDFSIVKLPHKLYQPVLSFADNTITVSCATPEADIFYKIGDMPFTQYSGPIEITEHTTVQAYSRITWQISDTVTQYFAYVKDIEDPVISCDGEVVEITCLTPNATIHYRIGTSSEFQTYTAPFEISSTVIVQAYSTLDDKQSETISTTCAYQPFVVSAPTISFSDNVVSISCDTPRSSIYYRTGGSGQYLPYTWGFEISETTLVEAYSTHNNQTSSTVSRTCTYVAPHDYANDYLTFRMRSPGNIVWKTEGDLPKTIQYSVNDGTWTEITSTSAGVEIPVSTGDMVRFKGSNDTYGG